MPLAVALVVLGALAAEGLKSVPRGGDTEAAWVERWRSGGADRCLVDKDEQAPHCAWLALAGPVDVGCRFDVASTGLAAGVASAGPALRVVAGRRTTPRTFHAEWERRELPLAAPALCSHGLDRDAPRRGGVVAVVAASSIPYVFKEWAALVNKVAYFGAMGVDWALWIGDLDDRLTVNETRTCAARADNLPGLREHKVSSKGSVYDGDRSRAVSNHLIKILAVYAMSDRPGVTGVAYVDLDAMAHREDILKLADETGHGPLRTGHGAETFLGTMLGTNHPKGFRMPFWQTSSNRFYVKARDPHAAKLLGLWMAHRCGFKDQLPLWHVLLAVAEEGSGGSCLRAHYHGKIFESMTYWAAHSYPKQLAAPKGYREDADALLTTCDELVAKCPKLRLCAHEDVVFAHLHHRTVEANSPPRKFAYFGAHNISHVIDLPDSLYYPFTLPDGSLVPRGAMRNNREFVEYFGLDLITAAARADADRGWSLASLYGPSHRGD